MSQYSNILLLVLISAVGLLADPSDVVYQPSEGECNDLKTIHGEIKKICDGKCGGMAPQTQSADNVNQNLTMSKCFFAEFLDRSPAANKTYNACVAKVESNTGDYVPCKTESGDRFLCHTNAFFCTIKSIMESCSEVFKALKDDGATNTIA